MTQPQPGGRQPWQPPAQAQGLPGGGQHLSTGPYGAPRPPAPGLAIAALVPGVSSLVLDFASFVFLITFLLAIPAGILAIVLGAIAIRRMNAPNAISEGRGMAIGGLVCGGVGAALGLAAAVFFVWPSWPSVPWTSSQSTR